MFEKVFFRILVGAYVAGFCLYLAAASTMFVIGEAGSLNWIAARQLSSPGVECKYQSAFRYDDFAYKQALYKQRPTEIALFGSSRGMQVRDFFFTRPFTNMSGGIGGVLGLMQAVDLTLRDNPEKRPATVIIMIDYWWFRSELGHNAFAPYQPSFSDNFIVPYTNEIARFLEYLRAGRVSATQVAASLIGCDRGLAAVVNGDGFRQDGSMDYYSYIVGNRRSPDYQFADTMQRIGDGTMQFEFGQEVNTDYVADLVSTIDMLTQGDIEVIAILSPLPEMVFDAMRDSDNYTYIPKLRQVLGEELGKTTARYYDFIEAASVDSSVCEFLDGFHGGEVTYARVFDAVRQDMNTDNINDLSDFIATNQAHPSAEYSQNNHLGFDCPL